MKHKIFYVEKESICHTMGVKPGDFLISINGQKIHDCFDYKFLTCDDVLLVVVETADGELWELDIEKNADDSLGLQFYEPLMSPLMYCKNKCVFCFVDQEPAGLRKTLYVKDDDYRHSFLHGNFITLSNMTEGDARRIVQLGLSPLRISVHATDLEVRKKIMGSEACGNLFEILDIFNEGKIALHFQIVLLKGINDGDVLDETIEKLFGCKNAKSLAIVPVGLTKHREGLLHLLSFSSEDSLRVIKQVDAKRKSLGIKRASNFVFLADEWYIKAGVELPAHKYYGEYPQLANGVGMARLFEVEFLKEMRKLPLSDKSSTVSIVTGELAYALLKHLMSMFCKKFRGLSAWVHMVKNTFYGDTVTVSGLLTGGDVLQQVAACGSVTFLPENAFRASTREMLDGTTLADLQIGLKTKIVIGSADGGMFAVQLYKELLC